MATHNHNKDIQMRQRLAMEAARIMDQEGVRDFHAAKRKAADRLSATDTRNMPSNAEIDQALQEYQRLFKSDSQPKRLRALREAAMQAMRYFARFHPVLVGSVLSGTANEFSDVNLHLFSDTPEEVQWFLMEEKIPFDNAQRRMRLTNGDTDSYPIYRFLAGDITIDLTVFPIDGQRQAPKSPVDGKPMRRANLAAVETLLANEAG